MKRALVERPDIEARRPRWQPAKSHRNNRGKYLDILGYLGGVREGFIDIAYTTAIADGVNVHARIPKFIGRRQLGGCALGHNDAIGGQGARLAIAIDLTYSAGTNGNVAGLRQESNVGFG